MTIALAQPAVASSVTSFSLGTPTTAGNCLVVCVCSYEASSAVSGITLGGSAGNFGAATASGGGLSAFTTIWVDWNCAGGQTALVVSGTLVVNASNGGIVAYEVGGLLATSAVVDQVSSDQAATGTAVTSGATPTTANPNEMWIGCADFGNGYASLPGSPWTSVSAGGGFACAGYQVVSAEAAATYSATAFSSAQWAASVVTLQGASAAAFLAPPNRPRGQAVNRASTY